KRPAPSRPGPRRRAGPAGQPALSHPAAWNAGGESLASRPAWWTTPSTGRLPSSARCTGPGRPAGSATFGSLVFLAREGAAMAGRPLTILFMPESAYGPTNNCIGIGDVLRRRGHRVVFAAEASWKGRLEPLGFEEDLVDLAPPGAGAADEGAGQFWKDFVRDTAPEFRKPTIEQLDTWVRPVWEELVGGAQYCQPQLAQIIK